MRIEKIAILDEVIARVKDSDYCFIIDHGGVTVAQFAKLRKALRALDSRLLVVKNTFLGKVAKEKGWSEEVNAMFKGNSAIVTGHGEPTAVAKAIMEFVKDSGGKASVKGADYDNKIVDAAMVEARLRRGYGGRGRRRTCSRGARRRGRCTVNQISLA